jgi:hypothetical protein
MTALGRPSCPQVPKTCASWPLAARVVSLLGLSGRERWKDAEILMLRH